MGNSIFSFGFARVSEVRHMFYKELIDGRFTLVVALALLPQNYGNVTGTHK